MGVYFRLAINASLSRTLSSRSAGVVLFKAASREACAADPLRQAADKADSTGRSEHRPVMVVHLVPQPRITDLVEAQELIEAQRASVGHQQPMKGDCESCLTESLNGSRLSKDACARRNQHMLSTVGEHGIRDQTIDGRRSASVQPVG